MLTLQGDWVGVDTTSGGVGALGVCVDDGSEGFRHLAHKLLHRGLVNLPKEFTSHGLSYTCSHARAILFIFLGRLIYLRRDLLIRKLKAVLGLVEPRVHINLVEALFHGWLH